MASPKSDGNSAEIPLIHEPAHGNDFVQSRITADSRYEETHQRRHKELHAALDELLQDYLLHHDRHWPETVAQLKNWSATQTIQPTAAFAIRG